MKKEKREEKERQKIQEKPGYKTWKIDKKKKQQKTYTTVLGPARR